MSKFVHNDITDRKLKLIVCLDYELMVDWRRPKPTLRPPRMVKQFGRLRGRQMCAKIALSQNGTAVIRG